LPTVALASVLALTLLVVIVIAVFGDRDTGNDQVVTPTTEQARVLRVVVAGDSVMAGLEPALRSVLVESGHQVSFALTPALQRDPTVRYAWAQRLEQDAPDVVVVLVGVWERQPNPGLDDEPGSPAWFEAYRATIVQPWLEATQSTGAQIVWVGPPPVAEPGLAAFFAALADMYRDVARSNRNVHFIDGSILGPSGPAQQSVQPAPDGSLRVIQQNDNLHLCPDGAQRLATPVLDWLRLRFDVPLNVSWANGWWESSADRYPAVDCLRVPTAS
jgi:hypothetical protein